MKKQILVISIIIIAMTSLACSDNADQLYDTAQFEELQNNQKHAIQLYEEIIEKYPNSKYAEKARKRLSQLRENP